jgi:hypothetical protein
MRAGPSARVTFAAAVAAFLLVSICGAAAWATPGDGPPLVTGSKLGPVAIGGGRNVPDTLVGTLDVPAGIWVAWAKLQFETEHSSSPTEKTVASCRLVSGNKSSKVSATLGLAGAAEFLKHGMELSLAKVLVRGGGQFRLYCRTQNGHPGTEARFIRMDALKVDQLTQMDLDDGTAAPAGSGDVVAITGEGNGSVDLGGAGDRKTVVASLALPTGNWWIRAELALHGHVIAVDCTMSVASSVDTVKVRVLGALSAVMDLTAHVGRGDPHLLAIKCGTDAEEGTSPAVIDQVRLTAMRASRLVEHNLGAGTDQSFGAGTPEVRSSFAYSAYMEVSQTTWSTVASLGLNAGDWLSFGRVGRYVLNVYGENSVYPDDIECELYGSSTTRDRDGVLFTNAAQVPTLPLLAYVPVTGRGGTTLLERCRTPFDPAADPPYIARVTRIRLTAVRVGSVDVQGI